MISINERIMSVHLLARKIAYSYTKNPALAEDLTQEALWGLLKYAKNYKEEQGEWCTYAGQTMRWIMYDYLKKHYNWENNRDEMQVVDEPVCEATPESLSILIEQTGILNKAIDSLSPNWQQCVRLDLLRDGDTSKQWTNDVLGAKIGKSRDNFRQTLKKAYKALTDEVLNVTGEHNN